MLGFLLATISCGANTRTRGSHPFTSVLFQKGGSPSRTKTELEHDFHHVPQQRNTHGCRLLHGHGMCQLVGHEELMAHAVGSAHLLQQHESWTAYMKRDGARAASLTSQQGTAPDEILQGPSKAMKLERQMPHCCSGEASLTIVFVVLVRRAVALFAALAALGSVSTLSGAWWP